MNSSKIIRVNPPIKKTVETAENQAVQGTKVNVDLDTLEFEQPQLESVTQLESLAENYPEDSVYGSGWSVAQLREEFRGI